MTFHIIGLGLTKNSMTQEAQEALKSCTQVYLESYTVNFPYTVEELSESLSKEIIVLNRAQTEDEHILKEAQEDDVALLVYGDALSATTHTQLLIACQEQNISYKVYHNASIFIAIAQTGLQLYKFGKTSSMPMWQKNFEPTSFLSYYKENKEHGAHTLVLTDIGLTSEMALSQLQQAAAQEKISINKIIIISHAGLEDQKIYFNTIESLSKLSIPMPFCIILPGEFHFLEKKAIETFKE